jgi:hypothetical protein
VSTQTIFRVASRHKPYSQLGNDMLRDKRLTLEQRGALALILSYPTNWSFDIRWLMKECDLGRDRARNIIAALTKYGYCQRAHVRKNDGTIDGYEFLFTDEPQHLVAPAPENPGPGLTGAGQPAPENPGPGFSGPIRKKDTYKKRKQNPLPPCRGPTQSEALQAFEIFNQAALRLGLPQASKLTPDRQRKILARLREYGLDGWQRALENLARSKFLTGRNDRNFRADLDFVCQAKSFGKLHDGGYSDDPPRRPAPARSGHATPLPDWIEEARKAVNA